MSLSARPPPITNVQQNYKYSLVGHFLYRQLAPSVGRTLYVHTFGHQMAHFSATFVMAGSSDTTRFSLLEFPTLPPIGMWVPPVFEPSQTFLFGSLDFIADRLGVLHLLEEALVLALVEGHPPSAPGHTTTSTTRRPRFVLSKLSAQTPL